MTKTVKCKKVSPKVFDKQVAKRFWFLMYILLLLSLFAQFLVDNDNHHFGIEALPLFYAAFGFFSCVIIVLLSKLLGMFFKREENYYDN
jgi:uncharacterized membrane-anchored protein YitT (DUF2179 family)